jgi:hypothetical protein
MITDIRPYQKYLDKFDLTEHQKLELVNALWVVVQSFVDKKCGLRPWDTRSMGQKCQDEMKELNPKSPPRNRTRKASNSN